MFKVKALTLDTEICQYIIPGIESLLQNSPELEKLTVVEGRGRFYMPVYSPLTSFLQLSSSSNISMNRFCIFYYTGGVS